MYLQQFFIDGLGCASYMLGCEAQGVAAVIDPDREIGKYLEVAKGRNLRITHIIETHLHADHVSGNTDLAQRTGATIYVHETAGAEFAHAMLKDGDVLALGNVQMTVQHTPGHTPESITLLVADKTRGDSPWFALTGDTLFVGDIGRPDLMGADVAQDLAGKMYDSLTGKILPLPDSLLIYPGHGAGSLCGRSIGSMRSTTLGYERRYNPALAERERNDFMAFATSNLPEQPGNHQRIKDMNRRGPTPLGDIVARPLNIREAIPYFQRGAALLDTRSKEAYISKHVPGSVHLPADNQFSNRVGFVLSPEFSLILIVDSEADYLQVVYSLARVGYEKVAGYLVENLDAWEAMGLPVASGDIEDITPDELHELLLTGNDSKPVVLDVREAWEYAQGHVPGAILIPLGQLDYRIADLDPEKPVAVICATGNRSQSGAALLGQKKFRKIYNVMQGTSGWVRRGFSLER